MPSNAISTTFYIEKAGTELVKGLIFMYDPETIFVKLKGKLRGSKIR